MRTKNKDFPISIIVFASLLISLLVSPFFNKDGMIIPKLIIMSSLGMYLIPLVIVNRNLFYGSAFFKILLSLHILIIIQSLFVLVISSAPLEQQIFGRTGRGLGLISIYSLTVVLLATALSADLNSRKKIIFGLLISAFISSLYSIAQSFSIDLLNWDSKTNGVIGTLGNPNFQSAFASMALVPSILYFWQSKRNLYLGIFLILFFSYTIYRTQSTQGIIAGFFSLGVAALIFFWYKHRLVFSFMFISGVVLAILSVAGMLNRGPLSGYLYKVSVQSRGDFWRSAFATANEYPIFGVGFDSFGDYSLKFRDQIAADHSFAEYTDNAHNFFLEQAATSGYPFAILNLVLVVLVIIAFFRFQKRVNKFDHFAVALFSSWVAFQMTTVISPGNLVTMQWNSIISGCILAVERYTPHLPSSNLQLNVMKPRKTPVTSPVFALAGFIFLMPLFNTDRLQLLGMQSGDANIVMKATTSYPESTVRYSLIGRELLESGLTQQALEIARAGVEFNPNSAGLWALVLVNPNTTLEERLNAKAMILELDPLNIAVRNYSP